MGIETTTVDGAIQQQTKPFDPAVTLANATSRSVELRVRDYEDRVQLEGETVTSILYSAPLDIAGFDLNVSCRES